MLLEEVKPGVMVDYYVLTTDEKPNKINLQIQTEPEEKFGCWVCHIDQVGMVDIEHIKHTSYRPEHEECIQLICHWVGEEPIDQVKEVEDLYDRYKNDKPLDCPQCHENKNVEIITNKKHSFVFVQCNTCQYDGNTVGFDHLPNPRTFKMAIDNWNFDERIHPGYVAMLRMMGHTLSALKRYGYRA